MQPSVPPEWSQMSDFYLELYSYVQAKLDLFFYGPGGVGKTSIIKSVLDKTNLPHAYVDCIHHTNENDISRHLAFTLFESIGAGKGIDRIPSSFSMLLAFIKHHIIYDKLHYLVFDNMGRMFNRKLFKKILALKSMLKHRIRLVLICDGFVPKTKYCDEFVLLAENFVQLLMPAPPKEHLQAVVLEKMGKLSHPEVFPIFIDLIHQTYSQYTTDIHYYLYLCKMLYPIFVHGFGSAPIKEEDIPKLYSDRFRKAGKALVENLYLPVANMSDIDVKTELYDETKEVDVFSKEEDTQIYGQTTKHGLTYLEGILLIAAYIACYNPEATDQKIFVKQKAKKRRVAVSSEMNFKIKARKADIERIVAIADYFLSSIDEYSYEYRALNHTTEFYSQLNNLVKQGYLRTHTPKKQDPSIVNYLAIVDYALIEEIAEDLDIHLFEYLYRGTMAKQSG